MYIFLSVYLSIYVWKQNIIKHNERGDRRREKERFHDRRGESLSLPPDAATPPRRVMFSWRKLTKVRGYQLLLSTSAMHFA